MYDTAYRCPCTYKEMKNRPWNGITLGIPTMACAGTPGEMQELENLEGCKGARKDPDPACGLTHGTVTNGNREEMFSLMEKCL